RGVSTRTPQPPSAMRPVPAPDAEFIAFQEAVAGRYSLERELGRGGMGIVYLARELRLARPVAIKVLPRALAAARPELREKFLREAQMAAQLSHPNIVPIHHVDEAGDFVFFVMAYIEGETLGERVRARGPLAPSEGARVLREIGWALAYAHSRGIVHRDVKPDNILLEHQTKRALVTDFGIAGAVRADAPADASYIRGTAHFLSPEQAMGEPTDGRSDIYSLGVVGYFALSGRLPFDGATTVQVMAAHISQRPREMHDLAPHVPRKLAAAVERCLAKDREQRWPSGEAFAEAVDAALEQPREIPAPLRVWLSKRDRVSLGRVALTVLFVGFPLGTAALSNPLLGFLAGLLGGVAINAVPEIAAVRRLLLRGFTLADMRNALRTYVVQRREEIEIDPTFAPISEGTLRFLAFAGLGTSAIATPVLINHVVMSSVASSVLALANVVSGVIGVTCAIGAILSKPRSRWLRQFGQARLDFWNGKWGERLVRLASFGLKRGVLPPPMSPQHTEVALGHATYALFEALPKNLRRDLKAVPATVARLEADAGALRASLDALDDLRGAGDDPEVQQQREIAAERLATTVTALENIRLGLLRLQLGSAPVAQVTEALDAAAHIAYEIDLALGADDEIGDVLRPKRIANRDPEPSPV
ncbi:MAG: serine/threonine-protein kinase, partial [Gemmatimonadaceae bacterium]